MEGCEAGYEAQRCVLHDNNFVSSTKPNRAESAVTWFVTPKISQFLIKSVSKEVSSTNAAIWFGH